MGNVLSTKTYYAMHDHVMRQKGNNVGYKFVIWNGYTRPYLDRKLTDIWV